MSYQKLIHEYLDEGLESPSEDILFAELNSNPLMRDEFNQQVKLHVIAQNDMGTISPPVESTNMIFSTLGFTIPSGQETPVAAKSEPAKQNNGGFRKLWNGNLSTIITAILTAVVTTLIVINLQEEQASVNADNNAVTANKIPLVSSLESNSANSSAGLLESNTPVDYSNAATVRDNNARTAAVRHNNTPVFVIPEIATDNDETLKTDNNDDNTIYRIDRTEISDYSRIGNINSGLDKIHPGPARYNQAGFILPFAENVSGLFNGKVEVNLRSLPVESSDIQATTNPFYNGFALNGLYKLDDNFSIGIEVGSEPISLEYLYAASDGQLRNRKQASNEFWFGPAVRWNPSITDDLSAYVQGTAAYINIAPGFMGRGTLGFRYNLYHNFNVNFGYEGFFMPYSINNSTELKTHSGITIGAGFNF